ncbi:MAG: hypothetical protein VB137_01750 [Burkholderia sp.]
MAAVTDKAARKKQALEDEIAKAAAKLKKLQDEQREQQRRARERDQKALLELLRAEGLDGIPVERWKEGLRAIKAALGVEGGVPKIVEG